MKKREAGINLLIVALVGTLLAADPKWWTEPETRILDPVAAENNHAPVLLGQLKNVAVQAKKHLDRHLPGGAGPEIDAMVANFGTDSDANHAPVLLGQLKNVAKPFYDRLQQVGYDTKTNLIAHGYPPDWSYDTPWGNPDAPNAGNKSPALIGQLKMVFSFDLSAWNTPPIVDAGPSRSTTSSSVLMADARAMDPEPGQPLTYQWKQESGPQSGGGTALALISDATALHPTISFSVTGEYSFRLTVSDGQAIRSDEVTIYYSPAGVQPTVSWVDPADGALFDYPTTVTLKTTATNATKIVYYIGTVDDQKKKIGESTSASTNYAVQWTPPRARVFHLIAKAVGTGGRAAISSMRVVQIGDYPGITGFFGTGDGGNNGTGPNPNDPNYDPEANDEDEDGLTDAEENRSGTDPGSQHSDNDGVPDGEDGWALDPDLFPPRLSEPHYVLIPLETLGFPRSEWISKAEDSTFGFAAIDGKGRVYFCCEDGDSPIGHVYKRFDPATGQSTRYESPGEGEPVANGPRHIGWQEMRLYDVSFDGHACGSIGDRLPGDLHGFGFDFAAFWEPDMSGLKLPLYYGSSGPGLNTYGSCTNGTAILGGGTYGDAVSVRWTSSGSTPTAFGEGNSLFGAVAANSTIAVGNMAYMPAYCYFSGGGAAQLAGSAADEPRAVNDAASPWIVGARYGSSGAEQACLWWGGAWTQKLLNGANGDPNGTEAVGVTDNFQIIGTFAKKGETAMKPSVVTNALAYPLEEICGDGLWTDFEILDTQTDGLILADARHGGAKQLCLLIPCDLAVDANRDGTIRFAGNYSDSAVAGKPQDTTSEGKPFRFWVNDDFDVDDDEKDSGTPDWQDGVIQCARDLEDFARIKIYVGGLREGFQSGKFKLGFEWKNTTGSPAVQIYPQVEESGGDGYLKDQQKAAAQVAPGVISPRLALVATGGSKLIGAGQAKVFPILPNSYGAHDFIDTGTIDLLFEACGEGKGQLCITVHDESGNKIGDGPGVWLDLKDVRKMYERSHSEVNIPWEKPSDYNPYQEPVVSIAPLDEVAFEKPEDETKDTLVWVHGINALDVTSETQAINRYTRSASTAFKRLWWQGFKGRFGFYKWEAQHLTQFNESDYRALKCGRGLALFLSQLPGDRKHVWTFSQGGMVASAAIRDYGATPNTLIIMQASAAAGMFDDNPSLNVYPTNPLKPDEVYPDTVSELGYRGYLGSGVTGVTIINFADPSDDATGVAWGASQNFKWEPHYAYDPSAPAGQRHTVTYTFSVGRFVTDLHESMSMIAHSQSLSIPHEPGARGAVADDVRIDTQFGFNNEHGACFDRTIQNNLNDFYDEVLLQCGIPFNP